MKKRYSVKEFFLPVVLLGLVLVIIYSGLRILESTVFRSPATVSEPAATKTVIRDGVKYFPRQDITVVMVLGIDRYGPVQASGYHRNQGAADSVVLLIFDETAKDYTVLCLNRDTMLDMNTLGVRGEYAGTAYGQLALAHTYGNGVEDSCENVKKTLMNFLHGLTVDYYVAMNMDVLPILNDAVGGVTVTVRDDFSKVNPSITMGELKLQGNQVLDFVRTRKDVGDQKNVTRMERQREYMNSFLQAFTRKTEENGDFALQLYDQIAPYIVTDCSVATLNSMLTRYEGFTLNDVVSPAGDNIVVDGYYQFHADAEKLDALVLDLFYSPK